MQNSTQLQQIISYIKALNFKALDNYVDDHKVFMRVPKTLFIETLEKELRSHRYEGLKSFDTILEGVCNCDCCKGKTAYRFVSNNNIGLDLYFKVVNGEVEDIALCHDIKVEDTTHEVLQTVYFYNYSDDKVDFIGNQEYHLDKNNAELAVNDFKSLVANNSFINIEALADWRERHKDIVIKQSEDPFAQGLFRAFEEFEPICVKINGILNYYDEKQYAELALKEYNSIDKEDEKSIEKWVLKHDEKYLVPYTDKFDNWKTTGLMILKTNPEVVVDCSGYLEAFMFAELHSKLEEKLNKK